MTLELYRAITNYLCEISVFSKRLQIQTINELKTAKTSSKFSLATFIVTYQPRMALRSVPKEDGVSSTRTKGPMLLVVSRDEIGPISYFPIFPDFTPRDFYLWGYVNNQVYQPPMSQSFRKL
jgi:hypothetical protein